MKVKTKALTEARGPQPAGANSALLARSGRMAKAARRLQRLSRIRGPGRGRTFVAGVLPVAMYAAEHVAWEAKEVQRLVGFTLRGSGAAGRGCRAPFP